MEFRTVIVVREDRITILVSGELDHVTSPRLQEATDQALAGCPRHIEVDLDQVTFCDCSALNVLLGAWDEAALRHPGPPGAARRSRPSRAAAAVPPMANHHTSGAVARTGDRSRPASSCRVRTPDGRPRTEALESLPAGGFRI
ncbi:STAS domain-containing protein [Streptomyces sp. NPDC058642]|uniref:STAS domain-containing protein n=1 Tax=Streptomyces sp. NPDC058642 TaxID=3346572 RepID=UPI003664C094